MKKNTTITKHKVFVVKTKEQGRILMSECEIDYTDGIKESGVTSDELTYCMRRTVKLFGDYTILSFKVRTLIVEISFRLEEEK